MSMKGSGADAVSYSDNGLLVGDEVNRVDADKGEISDEMGGRAE